MGWTWHDVQATPAPVLDEVLALMQEEAEDQRKARAEIEAARRRR